MKRKHSSDGDATRNRDDDEAGMAPPPTAEPHRRATAASAAAVFNDDVAEPGVVDRSGGGGLRLRATVQWTADSLPFWSVLCRNACHATDDGRHCVQRWVFDHQGTPPVLAADVRVTSDDGTWSWAARFNVLAHAIRDAAAQQIPPTAVAPRNEAMPSTARLNRPRCELLLVHVALSNLVRRVITERLSVDRLVVHVPSAYVATNATAERLRSWKKHGFPGILHRDLWTLIHGAFLRFGEDRVAFVGPPATETPF